MNSTYLFMGEAEEKLERARIYDGTAPKDADEATRQETNGMRCLCGLAWMRRHCFIKVAACKVAT